MIEQWLNAAWFQGLLRAIMLSWAYESEWESVPVHWETRDILLDCLFAGLQEQGWVEG